MMHSDALNYNTILLDYRSQLLILHRGWSPPASHLPLTPLAALLSMTTIWQPTMSRTRLKDFKHF